MSIRNAVVLVALAVVAASASSQPTVPQARIRETLRLDANTEDFSIVGPIKIGPAGQIAITFRQDGHVRVYDSTGKRLSTFGRKGQGPGEFAEMQVQGWRGDTVWVYDYVQNRHTFITQSGQLIRVVPLASGLTVRSASAAGPLSSTFAPAAMLADGSTLGRACLREAVNGSRMGIVRATPDGAPTIVATARFDETCSARAFHFNPLVFTPQTAFRPDGSFFAEIRVDSLVRAGGTFSIEVFDGSGRRRMAKTVPYAGEPIPARVVDSILAGMIPSPRNDPEGLMRQGANEAVAKARANVPPVYVPITGMLFGQDGTIWVLLRAKAGQSSALVLDANGNAVALVTVPPRSDVVAASASQMWVRERDDDGLTSIVRYRVDGIGCARTGCR